MIERVFAFCFGDQRHKYTVLVIAASIAATAILTVRGVEAGPASAPAIALFTVLVALPISALLRFFGREAPDRRFLRALAAAAMRLSRATGRVDDPVQVKSSAAPELLLGDLEEFYIQISQNEGRASANIWYLNEIIYFFFGKSWLAAVLRLEWIAFVLVALVLYTESFHIALRTPFKWWADLLYLSGATIGLLTVTRIATNHFTELTDRFTAEFKHFREEKHRITTPREHAPARD